MLRVQVIVPWLITKCFMMLLILVVIISSIHVISSDSPRYMSKECQEKNSYVSGSIFEANLNHTLFTQLLPKASTIKFSNYMVGLGEDQVYGLFYGKGDVDDQTCQDCVAVATRKIKDVCKSWKEGIVWFEDCTLRYANQNIFASGEVKPYYPYRNVTGTVNDNRLDHKFNSAMNSLIQEAANGKGTLQGFATKEVNISASGIIRGLAQCTPAIVGTECYKCLTTALRLRDSWANTMMFLPSCLFRYDLYETVSTPTPPSASCTLQGFHIGLIVVLPVVFIVLAVIGGRWLGKRCLKGRNSTGRVADQKLKNPPGEQPRNLVADIGDRVQGLPRYTFPQIKQMTKGFKKQLGAGGFGVVYYGRLLDNSSREVAVKLLNENDAPKQFSNEINVFVRISHKNLVSLLGYCEDGNSLALIYEYMDKGDLKGILADNTISLSWTDRLKIAIDTAEGLHYLHTHCEDHIVHRDVKPANILLNQNLQAKVADFGLSKIFPEKDVTTLRTRVIASLGYTAPDPHFKWKDCLDKNSYEPGSAFEANLNDTLFNKLLPRASKDRFWNHTVGFGEDQVYGLFYCKGDVDDQTCQDCVDVATRKIKDVCKAVKEGIVWFEECTLRYANRSIFSAVEITPYYPYRNTTGTVNDIVLGPYVDKFNSEMNSLIQEAANNEKGTTRGFATKEVNLSSTEIIRGLAQCTPDILGPRCHDCLKDALRLRDSWFNTMMFFPSCLFRYDYYKTGSTRPPAPSPPPPTKRGGHIALFAVPPVVLIVLAVIGGLWLRKCCSKGTVPDPPPKPDEHGLPRYTFSEVERMTKGFGTQIGKGGFGVVYRGRLLDGSREVAVKMLNENDAPKQFSNEINVFAQISHSNLVSLLGYCQEGTKLALIYEYMDKGDLRALLSDGEVSLSWTDRLRIAIDTAEGLHYLHRDCDVRIVHRDVKPANILLTRNLQAKVADFGLSKIFPEKDVTTLETRVIGTHGYKAPEYTATGLLNEKADVYSFGVVLVELITGKQPRLGFDLVKWFISEFNAADIEKILDKKVTGVQNYSSVWGATEIAKACVEEYERERPNMWEVVKNLKECLDMEVKMNAGTSRSGSTSIEIMSPIIPDSIVMEPEPK